MSSRAIFVLSGTCWKSIRQERSHTSGTRHVGGSHSSKMTWTPPIRIFWIFILSSSYRHNRKCMHFKITIRVFLRCSQILISRCILDQVSWRYVLPSTEDAHSLEDGSLGDLVSTRNPTCRVGGSSGSFICTETRTYAYCILVSGLQHSAIKQSIHLTNDKIKNIRINSLSSMFSLHPYWLWFGQFVILI